MSELISGKEALIALVNGESLQYRFPDGIWLDFTNNLNSSGSSLRVVDLLNDYACFRLKPRTITINGVKVPAPFKPKEGDEYWILFESNYSPCGYKLALPDDQYSELCYGAWRTEEEIKQVVAALRSIFNAE